MSSRNGFEMVDNIYNLKQLDKKKWVCRACLTFFKKDVVNFCLEDGSNAEIYTFCTSIEISDHDTFPKTICQTCYDLLNKCLYFKQQCLRSNETLLLNNNKLFPLQEKNEVTSIYQSDINLDIDAHNFKEKITENILFEDNTLNNDEKTDSEYISSSSQLVKKICKIKLKKKKKCRTEKYNKIIKKKRYLNEGKNLNYPCLLCNKKFAYPERLEAHKLLHDGVKKEILCSVCNKKFKQWDGLRRHREFVHMTSGKSLECSICGKLYKTTMTLKNHQKIHQERKDFVCHICGGFYRSTAGLQNHLDTHNKNREKNHECKVCGKKFVSNSYLTSHMFRHKERRFVCDICRFPFFTKADLARHMLIHNGIKPYVCEICNKAYSTKSFLTEHGRTHSGERPFNCDYCSMNFISKRRLIDHRRTHTGEKPHKCDKCNQAFIQRGSLTRHLKVHEK